MPSIAGFLIGMCAVAALVVLWIFCDDFEGIR